MNVNSVGAKQYAPLCNFKGCGKSENLGVTLPNPSEYDYEPLYTPYEKADRLKSEYKGKIMEACFDKDGKLNPRIRRHLDESKFVFELKEGCPEVMTIKEALKRSIMGESKVNMDMFHGTPTIEQRDSIIENGFDPKRISRAEFGPGIYFTPSEGEAMIYGNAKVLAKLKGRCARFDGPFYSKVANGAVLNAVQKFVGLKSKGYPTTQLEHESAQRIVNEYVRTVLCDELGYDFGYGASRSKACYVAFNPEAITDIKRF